MGLVLRRGRIINKFQFRWELVILFGNDTPADDFKFGMWQNYERKALKINYEFSKNISSKFEEDKPWSSKDLNNIEPTVIDEKVWDEIIDAQVADPEKRGRISIGVGLGKSDEKTVEHDKDEKNDNVMKESKTTYPYPIIYDPKINSVHAETSYIVSKTPRVKSPPFTMNSPIVKTQPLVKKNLRLL